MFFLSCNEFVKCEPQTRSLQDTSWKATNGHALTAGDVGVDRRREAMTCLNGEAVWLLDKKV